MTAVQWLSFFVALEGFLILVLVGRAHRMEGRMSKFDDAVTGLTSDLATLKAQVDAVQAGSVPIDAATAAVNTARTSVQAISAELPAAPTAPAAS